MRPLDQGQYPVLDCIEAYLTGDFSDIVDKESELHEALEEDNRILQLQTVTNRAGKETHAYPSNVTKRRYIDRSGDLGPDKAVIDVGERVGHTSPTSVTFFVDEHNRNRVKVEDSQRYTWKDLIQNFNPLEPVIRINRYSASRKFEVDQDESPQEVIERVNNNSPAEISATDSPKYEIPKNEPGFEARYHGGSLEYGNTGMAVYAKTFTDQLEGVLETLEELDATNPDAPSTSPKIRTTSD